MTFAMPSIIKQNNGYEKIADPGVDEEASAMTMAPHARAIPPEGEAPRYLLPPSAHSGPWRPDQLLEAESFEPALAGQKADTPRQGLAAPPRLDGVYESRAGSSVFLIFPNTGIAAGEPCFEVFTVEPLTAETCKLAVRSFILPTVLPDSASADAATACTARAPQDRRVRVAPSNPDGDFVGQGEYAAEALQRALRSPAFQVGPLARPRGPDPLAPAIGD
ncbi:MAG: hypothetical protein IM664_09925 [Phenylobacterium sp.]|uniref:SRPBCC family protein n=2 Tax=Phenylobacterium sp. TaxID=1871053 RepID=UPI0025DD75A7|nr:SRPBCC family protein [Phenylobacterium sp.]MCA3724130.1 hypothetical protein [Phenylobacterium sp.]MCA3726038.1 hypothetical protein [Phenylobacterium sp.]MCA6334907.1 hypothetical protein [Phenylobacterium sp.]